MRPFPDLPIGRKLVLAGVSASAVALLVASLIFLGSTLLALRTAARNELEAQAAVVADNTAAAIAFLDHKAASDTIGALRATSRVNLACVYDQSGALFAQYAARGFPRRCPAAPPPDGETLGRTIEVVVPVLQRDLRIGTLGLEGNFSEVWEGVAGQVLAGLAGIALGVSAAILLSGRLQRVIADPVIELSSTAAQISKRGDYSLRATRHGRDEIGQLVDTFNAMVAEVERRDEQLRASNRSKDDFLAALSHELRTPLNAVLGWIQVLRTTGQADPALVARAYASIERNAKAQTTLIEDLLDVSRIVSGKLHLAAEPVDVSAVIDAALEASRPSADAKQITVTRDVLPPPQWVHGDPNRLEQVVANLLSNAVKFTPEGGRISLVLRAVDESYVLRITDDGIGMAPEFLPHAFERFRQGDGSLARPHRGLGLGLAIARELVELHGGTISASSDGVGLGATFTVTLPRLNLRPSAGAAWTGGTNRRLDGLSVLVVDDDEDARELARLVLSAAGAFVTLAGSADAALTILGTRQFDVLLCDLAMPGVDGYELLRRLRAHEEAAGRTPIPAIAVSAHAGPAVQSKVEQLGFETLIAKPYEIHVLIEEIARSAKGA